MLMTTGLQFLSPGWALLSVKFCPMQATEADFVTFHENWKCRLLLAVRGLNCIDWVWLESRP
jgi:hypothetical protein